MMKNPFTMSNARRLTTRVFVASALDKSRSPANQDGDWLNHLSVSSEGNFIPLDEKKLVLEGDPKILLAMGLIDIPRVTGNVPGPMIKRHFGHELQRAKMRVV